jgi:hypothetical protein
MTPEEFITAMFGDGWTQEQLPVFLSMVERFQEDAQRYYEIRDALTEECFAPSRAQLDAIDSLMDSRRDFVIV